MGGIDNKSYLNWDGGVVVGGLRFGVTPKQFCFVSKHYCIDEFYIKPYGSE